jgi:hypothetical protein
VEAAQRIDGIPKLTAAQDEALDLLAELAEELCFEMELRAGDIQLLNNHDIQLLNKHVTYHARTAFEDDAAAGRDRLLLRLWLSVPNSRALPPGFGQRRARRAPRRYRPGLSPGSAATSRSRAAPPRRPAWRRP